MARSNKISKSSLLQKVEAGFLLFEESLNGSKSSSRHAIRRRAFNKLEQLDFPSRKHEEYKYTNLTKKIDSEFASFDVLSGEIVNPSTNYLNSADGYYYFFTNGRFNEQKSYRSENTEFSVTTSENETSSLNSLESSLKANDSFELLNAVFSEEGIAFHINKGQTLSKPIFIIHELDGNQVSQPRVVVNAGQGSSAVISEIHYSKGLKYCFTNSHTNFNIGSDAHITHLRTGLESANSIRVNTSSANQEANSVFTSINTDLGGEYIRNNLNVSQNGSGCVTNMYGLYALSGNMHVDNHTSVDHKFPNTESNELYKGILTGNSTGVFNGKIFVRQDAQKTNAYQQNSNILLSDEAVIYTKPQLEIWADDVKCSHGCTTGRLDKEQIFYLRTRGISERDAKAMLLHAYAVDVLNHIPIKELRSLLDEQIIKIVNNA